MPIHKSCGKANTSSPRPVGFVLAEVQAWVRQRFALREVAA